MKNLHTFWDRLTLVVGILAAIAAVLWILFWFVANWFLTFRFMFGV